MKRLLKQVKDKVRLSDRLTTLGARRTHKKGGLYDEEGNMPSVAVIMKSFGVDRSTAESIRRRRAR